MRDNGGNICRKGITTGSGIECSGKGIAHGNHIDSHFMPVDPKKEPANDLYVLPGYVNEGVALSLEPTALVIGEVTCADQGTRNRKAGGLYILAFE